MLVISSHGYEAQVTENQSNSNAYMYLPNDAEVWRHAIQGVDGHLIYVDDILDMFDDKKVPNSYLKGKPKLFFLQVYFIRFIYWSTSQNLSKQDIYLGHNINNNNY